jgi:hypothetical protein
MLTLYEIIVALVIFTLIAIVFGGWVKRQATKLGVERVTFFNSRAILALGLFVSGVVAWPLMVALFSAMCPNLTIARVYDLLSIVVAIDFTFAYVFMVFAGTWWWSTTLSISARVFLGWYVSWMALIVVFGFDLLGLRSAPIELLENFPEWICAVSM